MSGILNRPKFRMLGESFTCQKVGCSHWRQAPEGGRPRETSASPVCCCPVHNYGNSSMRVQRGKLEVKSVSFIPPRSVLRSRMLNPVSTGCWKVHWA